MIEFDLDKFTDGCDAVSSNGYEAYFNHFVELDGERKLIIFKIDCTGVHSEYVYNLDGTDTSGNDDLIYMKS